MEGMGSEWDWDTRCETPKESLRELCFLKKDKQSCVVPRGGKFVETQGRMEITGVREQGCSEQLCLN